jgi:hypothetical protein
LVDSSYATEEIIVALLMNKKTNNSLYAIMLLGKLGETFLLLMAYLKLEISSFFLEKRKIEQNMKIVFACKNQIRNFISFYSRKIRRNCKLF